MKNLLWAYLLCLLYTTINAQEQRFGTGLKFDESLYNEIPQSVPLVTRSFTVLPKAYSIKGYAPTPGNQRSQGSCVGWASAYGARTIANAVKNNWKHNTAKINQNTFSPAFVYNQIRYNEKCQGAFIENAMKLMNSYGAAKMSDFTYDYTTCLKTPNTYVYNKAKNHNTPNVPLKYGVNELEVKATDLKQASSTKRFTIKRKSAETNNTIVTNNTPNVKIDVGFGKYYALIIGVSNYEDKNIVDLNGEPTKDAQALADVLIAKYGFDTTNVTILKNPTDSQINRSFYQLRKKVGKTDNLLVFYAGHGNYDDASERGYWMPSNANMEFEDNIILNTTIVSHIKAINSKHTLLIADACFSGSIFKSRSYIQEEKNAKRKYALTSRKAITSGTLKTVPNKSVFIKYLLKRLHENQDSYLSARKLFDRIEEPVMNNSSNTPQRGVIHGAGDEGGDFIFIKKI